MRALFFILKLFSFTIAARLLIEWALALVRRRTGGEAPEFFQESAWWIALAIGASLAVVV